MKKKAIAYLHADVKRIRARLGVSQAEFASMIGVSVGTLRNWEQGRRTPEGPARALLKAAAENPNMLAEALGVYAAGKPRKRAAPPPVRSRKPSSRKGGYTLKRLLAGVTKSNRHEEWDTGPPVGREVW